MAFLMTDVAAGSTAARNLQQNVLGAQYDEANIAAVAEENQLKLQQNRIKTMYAPEEAQLKLEQDKLGNEKTRLANLVTDTNFKASEDSKAKLKALEAADDYHLEETKEGKKRVTSEYEKELDEKIKNLLNEKSNVEKQQKVSKTPKTEQDKIDEINREIKFVKETKSVYDQAIKDPKKASDALIAAREERDKTYAALGLKLEKNAKAPILIERNYQEALKEIENSYFSDQEKNNKIAELKAQRDSLAIQLQDNQLQQELNESLIDYLRNYNRLRK